MGPGTGGVDGVTAVAGRPVGAGAGCPAGIGTGPKVGSGTGPGIWAGPISSERDDNLLSDFDFCKSKDNLSSGGSSMDTLPPGE